MAADIQAAVLASLADMPYPPGPAAPPLPVRRAYADTELPAEPTQYVHTAPTKSKMLVPTLPGGPVAAAEGDGEAVPVKNEMQPLAVVQGVLVKRRGYDAAFVFSALPTNSLATAAFVT